MHEIDGAASFVMSAHDNTAWPAFYHFKRRYGGAALQRLKDKYQNEMPANNLHFIMGTQKAHPHIFMIIGLLRTGENLEEITRQSEFNF